MFLCVTAFIICVLWMFFKDNLRNIYLAIFVFLSSFASLNVKPCFVFNSNDSGVASLRKHLCLANSNFNPDINYLFSSISPWFNCGISILANYPFAKLMVFYSEGVFGASGNCQNQCDGLSYVIQLPLDTYFKIVKSTHIMKFGAMRNVPIIGF